MENFPVSDIKVQQLRERMLKLGIQECDLEESFIRSGGNGGQNVNKVSTCVVIKHLPTGHTVRCQQERSQALNRYIARKILVDKIENEKLGKLSEERQRIEKIRRQKRKRSKRARNKMLDGKKMHGEKKSLRKKMGRGEF